MLRVEELIEDAQQAGHTPRLHPNGFIQLDLRPGERLHIWDPDNNFPQPEVDAQIHDHTFSFTSHVLTGVLLNTHHTEHTDNIGSYRIFRVLPFLATGQQTSFETTDDSRYMLAADPTDALTSGMDYAFPAFHFHDTQAERFTATIMRVSTFDPSQTARVAIAFPAEPDRSFQRDCVPAEELWAVIAKLRTLPLLL